MKKLRTWREYLIKQLAANRDEAFGYIQFAIEEYQADGDTSVLLLSLKTFMESQGGIEKVAQRTGIAPETLLEILSSEEAPRVDMLGTILKVLGGKLSIESLESLDSHIDLAVADSSGTSMEAANPSMELVKETQQ